MSPLTLLSGSNWSADDAWQLREGRKKRYNGQRLGGTVVVHFIKKHMWFFETVLALLGGEEETEYEMQRRIRQEPLRERETALSQIGSTSTHSSGTGRRRELSFSGYGRLPPSAFNC
jgi:hypothetical protein